MHLGSLQAAQHPGTGASTGSTSGRRDADAVEVSSPCSARSPPPCIPSVPAEALGPWHRRPLPAAPGQAAPERGQTKADVIQEHPHPIPRASSAREPVHTNVTGSCRTRFVPALTDQEIRRSQLQAGSHCRQAACFLLFPNS